MMTHSDPPSDVRPDGEHRRAKRVRPGPLRVRLHRTCEGILVDISESGALVQVPWALSPDRQVTFLRAPRHRDQSFHRIVITHSTPS